MTVTRFTQLFYAYIVCMNLVFFLPIIVPYYTNQLGLTFRDFMIGEALFAAVIIIMEVPSGWLSDVWSRKGTLMIGALTGIIGYSLLLAATGFYSALLAQGVIGAAVALNSGTTTAILYDFLASKGREDDYQKLEGKRHGIGMYSVAIGSVLGGILYHYDMRLPLMMDVITLCVAIIILAFLPEPPRIKRTVEGSPIRDIMKTVRYAVHGHKEIAGIILVSMVLFCTTKMVMWTQQPYMIFTDVPTQWFGYIMATGFLIGGFAGQFGHYIRHTLSNRQMIMVLAIFTGFMVSVAALVPAQGMIVFILMVPAVWGFGFPFVQNAINKHADPARRATILSTMGLLISVIFIPSGIIMGVLDDAYNIRVTLMYLVIQLAVLSTIGLYIWARGTRQTRV